MDSILLSISQCPMKSKQMKVLEALPLAKAHSSIHLSRYFLLRSFAVSSTHKFIGAFAKQYLVPAVALQLSPG